MGKKENGALAICKLIRSEVSEFSKKIVRSRGRLLLTRHFIGKDNHSVNIFPHLLSPNLFYLSHSARMYHGRSNNIFYSVNFNPLFAFYSSFNNNQKAKIYKQNINTNWNIINNSTTFTHNIRISAAKNVAGNNYVNYIKQYPLAGATGKSGNVMSVLKNNNNLYSLFYSAAQKYFISTNSSNGDTQQSNRRKANATGKSGNVVSVLKNTNNLYSLFYPAVQKYFISTNISNGNMQQGSLREANATNNLSQRFLGQSPDASRSDTSIINNNARFYSPVQKYFTPFNKTVNSQYSYLAASITNKEAIFNSSRSINIQGINNTKLIHKTVAAPDNAPNTEYSSINIKNPSLAHYERSAVVQSKSLPDNPIKNQPTAQSVIPDNGNKRIIAPQDIDMNSLFNDLYNRLESKLKVERERRGVF